MTSAGRRARSSGVILTVAVGTFLAVALAAGGARAQAQSQAGGAAAGGAAGQRPPVRATSTVEVIDVGRGVDEIISKVRGQQRGQGGAPRAAGTDKGPTAGTPPRAEQQAAAQAAAAHEHDGDDLRPERPERPRSRPDHERHDPHRADHDAARRAQQQADRARESHRP
jgi:hypothetical protein